jgi:hypothetical protein
MRTAEAVRAPKNPSRATALCGVFLRHILARRKPAVCFMGGPKRHIQPERYATFWLKFLKIIEKTVDKK